MWNENSRCFMRSLVIHLTFILKSDIWMHNRHKMLSVPCARFTAYILSVSSTYTTTTLSFVLLNYLYSVNVDIPTWYLYFSVFSCIFATLWSLYFDCILTQYCKYNFFKHNLIILYVVRKFLMFPFSTPFQFSSTFLSFFIDYWKSLLLKIVIYATSFKWGCFYYSIYQQCWSNTSHKRFLQSAAKRKLNFSNAKH